MNIELDERAIADRCEAVNLARFDDENVTRASFERVSVYNVFAAPRLDELNFVVGMTMRTGAAPCLTVEQEHRDRDVSVVSADEIVRAPAMRQIRYSKFVHVS